MDQFKKSNSVNQNTSSGNTTNYIKSLPYTIKTPGKYYICHNLEYSDDNNAITIESNDVDLDFKKNTLTLSNVNTIGINVINSINVNIFNSNIKSTVIMDNQLKSTGIWIIDSKKVNVVNSYINNISFGIYTQNSKNITINSSYIQGGFKHLGFYQTDSLVVKNSTITNLTMTINSNIIIYDCNNIKFNNLNINNCDIFHRSGNNSIFSNINSKITDPNGKFGNMQLGLSKDPELKLENVVSNCIIENCNFINNSQQLKGPAVLYIINANDVLINKSLFKFNQTIPDLKPIATAVVAIGRSNIKELSGLLGGKFEVSVKNIKFNNCIIDGNVNYAVIMASESNEVNGVVFDNNLISSTIDNSYALYALNTNYSHIMNNQLQNIKNNGMNIVGNSKGNIISNNVLSGSKNGYGLSLDINTSKNLVKNNNFIDNYLQIINNGNNVLMDNIII